MKNMICTRSSFLKSEQRLYIYLCSIEPRDIGDGVRFPISPHPISV